MAEAQGQAVTQPTVEARIPDSLNPHEAAGVLAQMLESGQIQENGAPGEPQEQQAPAPRNEKGQFQKQETPKEAQPEMEAKPEETQQAEPEVETETKPAWSLKIKYKGEEREITQPEEAAELAQKGYDYTQKMQQLSQERAENAAKVKAETEKALKQYESQLETYKKAVSQVSGVKSMQEIEALSRTDPVAAQQEFLKSLNVNQTLAAIEAEQAKISNQRQSEAQESFAKQAREAVEKLQERIPGWNNDLYGKILKGAVDNYGFEQREVNAITDHRAIELMNDALKWREFQSAKPKTVEKKVPPVAPKVVKPGTTERPAKPNKSQDAMAKLQKDGSRQSAQDYVLSLIEEGKLG